MNRVLHCENFKIKIAIFLEKENCHLGRNLFQIKKMFRHWTYLLLRRTNLPAMVLHYYILCDVLLQKATGERPRDTSLSEFYFPVAKNLGLTNHHDDKVNKMDVRASHLNSGCYRGFS